MVYHWKISLMPVEAQTPGEELARIYNKYGKLDPKNIVDESRAETALLHSCFEWDDEIAAEKYRETQAATIVRALTVSESDEQAQERETRAYVHVQCSYHPLTVVVEDKDMLEELLLSAEREMGWFCKKYRELTQLAPVIDAMTRYAERRDKC